MDISLYYQESGTGEPLFLLHGNGEDSSYFDQQIRYFSGSYRVIAVDTRGHGKSPRGTAPFTMEQFATDLYDLMTELEIPESVILGFSDGANIALTFALKYPHKVKALILNGANLYPKGMKKYVLTSIRIKYKAVQKYAATSENARHKMELLGLMVNEPQIKPDALHAIQVPTLVIAGSRDIIKQTHTELIAKHIPGAVLKIIPGDHFIAAKQAGPFNHETGIFLEALQTHAPERS